MKNKIVYLTISIILLIFLIINGCTGLAIKTKIIDNYYLIASDVEEDCTLSYHKSSDGNNYGVIINATVFSVGYNSEYIIVKQHPKISETYLNQKITNYYIVPLKKEMNWRTKNGLIGPLDLAEFNQKKQELNLNDIEFTIVLKDLE